MPPQRRRRVWSTTDGVISLVAIGIGGQISLDLGANLRTTLGLQSLAGFTIARTHLCAQVSAAANNTAVTQQRIFMGMGIFADMIDNADFPDLETYQGDWFGYECLTFQGPGVASVPVVPESAGFVRSDYHSMRKIKSGETAFLVLQETPVADDYEVNVVVSSLWLMP